MNASFVHLPDRGLITLAGPEAVTLLQGLISQDVETVTAERSSYGALLTPQGKYLHDFLLLRLDDAITLECEAARRDDLYKRLRRYRLRSAAEIADHTDELDVFAIFGQTVPAVFGLPDKPGATKAWESGHVYVDPRRVELGCRAVFPAGQGVHALVASGLTETTRDTYDTHRARLGVPDGSRDMQVEKSTLLEANIDRLNGIDWQKGCYVGQELTARTKHRGLLKRRLHPVRLMGSAEPGTPITLGARAVGELRSVAGDYGLALLRLDALEDMANQPLMAGPVPIDVPPDPLADDGVSA